MKLVLIEGVPGSGKSTLAKNLAGKLTSIGLECSWYLEEAKDHPVHGYAKGKRQKVPDQFLHEWEHFVRSNVEKDHVFILEGSLFQSTVRFLLDANNEVAIPSYYKACTEILKQCSVKLIYLRPKSIPMHINWVCKHRGEEWASKVTTYLSETPFCKHRDWSACDIQKSYWLYYAELCDALVLDPSIPDRTILTGEGHFAHLLRQARQFVDCDKRSLQK